MSSKGTVTEDPYKPAGFWIRGGALGIDSGIIILLGKILSSGLQPLDVSARAIHIIQLLLGATYIVLMIGSTGQTVGKRLAGIKVIRADSNASIGFKLSVVRLLAQSLSTMVLYIGFLMAAWRNKKEGLHDLLAGTRVVCLPNIGVGRKTAAFVLGFGIIVLPIFEVISRHLTSPQSKKPDAMDEIRRLETANRDLQLRDAHFRELHETANKLKIKLATISPQPRTIEELSKQFPNMPMLKLDQHGSTNGIEFFDSHAARRQNRIPSVVGKTVPAIPDPTKIRDTGKWGYIAPDSVNGNSAGLFIDCTHTDEYGSPYYTY